MVDIATAVQRQASSTIHIGDDFSYPLAEYVANQESFDQTIVEIGSPQAGHFVNGDYLQDEVNRDHNVEYTTY